MSSNPLGSMSPLLRDLLNTMSIPCTAAPPRIPVELDGVSLGQLMTALRFSGLVISNRDGVLVIHPTDKEVCDGTAQR